MSLNKTIAILAGITAFGTTHADTYTDAANPDAPTLGNLAANYNETAPKVSTAALKGATEFIAANELSVKSGKISAADYAKQTAQKLLTPGDAMIAILPVKLTQACLTAYGADLMQQSADSIKEITKSEAAMRSLAEQVDRTENPNMAHNLTSDLGVSLIKHDIATNLTQGRTQTAKACFELAGALKAEKPSQTAIESAQKKGTEGLDTIKNFENPFDFSAKEVAYLMEQNPDLKKKEIDKMDTQKRNETIKDFILRQDSKARAEVYLKKYQDSSTLTVSAPARDTTATDKTSIAFKAVHTKGKGMA